MEGKACVFSEIWPDERSAEIGSPCSLMPRKEVNNKILIIAFNYLN